MTTSDEPARHEAEVLWQRGTQDFLDGRYSRAHVLRFDGGAEVRASSSPHVVPAPLSDPAGVDPEEAFVAALASCHMLWFLSLAARAGLRVDRYHDRPWGVLEKNAAGKLAITQVTLRPDVRFSGERTPAPAELDRLHHDAHEACFLASSVHTDVRCEPVVAPA